MAMSETFEGGGGGVGKSKCFLETPCRGTRIEQEVQVCHLASLERKYEEFIV